MLEKQQRHANAIPVLYFDRVYAAMDIEEDETVPVYEYQSDEPTEKYNCRSKRYISRKITLRHLLKVICASREACLEWLQKKGFIPRILFCPDCNKKMKFEAYLFATDGYRWICRECPPDDPPQFSSRHGSWLESKDAPLVDVLLFTYLWAHGIPVDQIRKETNVSRSNIQEWILIYASICESLYQRNRHRGVIGDGNSLDTNKESAVEIWRRKNKYKDQFLQFLKDADSL